MMYRNVILSEPLALIQATFRPMITNWKMMIRNIWWRYELEDDDKEYLVEVEY